MSDYLANSLSKVMDVIKTFSMADALDIILIAFLIYGFIKLIRETRAEQLVKGILLMLFAWILSTQLNLKMLGAVLSNFFEFSMLAILVVFQPEIRRALEQIGRARIGDYWSSLGSASDESKTELFNKGINSICKVCSSF